MMARAMTALDQKQRRVSLYVIFLQVRQLAPPPQYEQLYTFSYQMRQRFSSVLLKCWVRTLSPKAEAIHLQLFAMKLFWKNELFWDSNAQKNVYLPQLCASRPFFLEADLYTCILQFNNI